MNWSVKAILARFDGNHQKAIFYCVDMAAAYPALREEYSGYERVLSQAMAAGA